MLVIPSLHISDDPLLTSDRDKTDHGSVKEEFKSYLQKRMSNRTLSNKSSPNLNNLE